MTRLDVVGFGTNTGGGVCDLVREGNTLPALGPSILEHSYVRDHCGKGGSSTGFGVCPTNGLPKDTNNNATDFFFVDTQSTPTVAGQHLGAPSPENQASPLLRNSTIATLFLDATKPATLAPNRVRDLTPVPNGANGTLTIRRRFVNNTDAPVTRLRFRIVDISSLPTPPGVADVRGLSSLDISVGGVTDAGTCAAEPGSPAPPCTVTVRGTTLEQPPNQTLGGGNNATMVVGTITLDTPLASGVSVNVQWTLGVQTTGSFKFFVNIEALRN